MVGTGTVMLIAVGILGLILLNAKKSLVDQNIASRWSEDKDFAHNTVYFSTRAKVDKKQIEHFRSEVVKGFEKKSIVASFEPTEGTPANLLDCYAAFDTLTISSEIRNESTFDAIGVGGDFFRFHPVQMYDGCYFDDDNIMQDYVILDEEAAWTLFGSMDVAGMKVRFGEKDLYVAGVYKRGQSSVEKLAFGNDDPKVFVNYETMAANKEDLAITVYELLAPNPIPHSAYNVIKDIKLFDADTYKVLENSDRFSYVHYFELLKESKAREMRTDDIGFPYWENVARYKEGKMMRVAHAQWIIAGILAIMIIVNVIWFLVDHKPTKKDFEKVVDSVREKRRKKRYEEMRQKQIEEEFGPEPEVKELTSETRSSEEESETPDTATSDAATSDTETSDAATDDDGFVKEKPAEEDAFDMPSEDSIVASTEAEIRASGKSDNSLNAEENKASGEQEETPGADETEAEKTPDDSVDLRLK